MNDSHSQQTIIHFSPCIESHLCVTCTIIYLLLSSCIFSITQVKHVHGLHETVFNEMARFFYPKHTQVVRDGSAGRQRVLQRVDPVAVRTDRTSGLDRGNSRHRSRSPSFGRPGECQQRRHAVGRAAVPTRNRRERHLLRNRLLQRRPRQQNRNRYSTTRCGTVRRWQRMFYRVAKTPIVFGKNNHNNITSTNM